MKSSGVQELGRLRDGAIWGGFTQVVEEKVTVSQSFFDAVVQIFMGGVVLSK
jgi:hypothetical protein